MIQIVAWSVQGHGFVPLVSRTLLLPHEPFLRNFLVPFLSLNLGIKS